MVMVAGGKMAKMIVKCECENAGSSCNGDGQISFEWS